MIIGREWDDIQICFDDGSHFLFSFFCFYYLSIDMDPWNRGFSRGNDYSDRNERFIESNQNDYKMPKEEPRCSNCKSDYNHRCGKCGFSSCSCGVARHKCPNN